MTDRHHRGDRPEPRRARLLCGNSGEGDGDLGERERALRGRARGRPWVGSAAARRQAGDCHRLGWLAHAPGDRDVDLIGQDLRLPVGPLPAGPAVFLEDGRAPDADAAEGYRLPQGAALLDGPVLGDSALELVGTFSAIDCTGSGSSTASWAAELVVSLPARSRHGSSNGPAPPARARRTGWPRRHRPDAHHAGGRRPAPRATPDLRRAEDLEDAADDDADDHDEADGPPC